jgi:hypothetical protein
LTLSDMHDTISRLGCPPQNPKGGDNIKKLDKKNAKKIGSDRDDFDLEVVSVKIKKTLRERFHDAVWTGAVTVIAVTAVNVFIIPMFG